MPSRSSSLRSWFATIRSFIHAWAIVIGTFLLACLIPIEVLIFYARWAITGRSVPNHTLAVLFLVNELSWRNYWKGEDEDGPTDDTNP